MSLCQTTPIVGAYQSKTQSRATSETTDANLFIDYLGPHPITGSKLRGGAEAAVLIRLRLKANYVGNGWSWTIYVHQCGQRDMG